MKNLKLSILLLFTAFTLNSQVKVATFHGISDIDVHAFMQLGFMSADGETIRPLGTNFLKNGQVTSEYKFLDNIFNQPTGNSGLAFPDINTAPPIGYKVSYFVDYDYKVTGWNWRRTTSNGGFNTLSDATAALEQYIIEHPIAAPDETIGIIPKVIGPPVINETGTYAGSYAQIGVTYTAPEKAIIHAASYRDDFNAQYYTIKHNGEVIFELNAKNGYSPSKVYWGNHPKEAQIPVENGTYEFYFANTADSPCIVGVTHNDPYYQYRKGGLSSAAYSRYLKPNESIVFNLDITDYENRSYRKNYFDLYCPLYEDGKLCLDKIEIENCPNGIQIPINSVGGFKFYKWNDPSKFIEVLITTNGYDQPATYKVVRKNGLEIDTRHIVLSAYNITIHKVFNNNSTGYGDSPDFREK